MAQLSARCAEAVYVYAKSSTADFSCKYITGKRMLYVAFFIGIDNRLSTRSLIKQHLMFC